VQTQGKASIERMCELARVSRAGFYRDWQQQQPDEAETEIRDRIQKEALKQRRFGYRRITALLKKSGVSVGEGVVRRILRSDNLLAVRRRKFVVTTDSKHPFTVYSNIAQYVKVEAVNQLWVADMTYIRLGREFVYLAVVLDVFSRKVVGWSLGRSLHSTLPLAALDQALEGRKPQRGLVHHSDRGSQYASDDYVKRLEAHGITVSMSRPARPWENGYCESFMNILKSEEITCRVYSTLEELKCNIADFIERYYNRERLHSALAYVAPEEFENNSSAQSKLDAFGVPLALSFPRHLEIYPDAATLRASESGAPLSE
jgi:putative transposase